MKDAGKEGSFFFFQAEDGIRDLIVTGVQTCALPISPNTSWSPSSFVTGCAGLNRGSLLAPGHSYSAFWTYSMVVGNISTLPIWSGWVCEMAIALMSAGLTPS